MPSIRRRLLLYRIWIRELFRFCPIRRKKIDKKTVFLNCGHRGSPVREPENTIPSFERAFIEGVNSLETDLCVTKDEEIILWHDWNPDDLVAVLRERGLEPDVGFKPYYPSPFSGFRNRTSELTLKEVREHFKYVRKGESVPVEAHIPTLTEFLDWLRNKDRIEYVFLDVKVPGDEKEKILLILDTLHEYIREYDLKTKFLIESFSQAVLETAKSKFSDLNYCLDVELPPGFVLLPSRHSSVKVAVKNENSTAVILRPRKITVANWITYRRVIAYDVLKRKLINRKGKVKVDMLIGCTVNNKKELKCLIKSGINGIQTDYPARLTSLVNKYELNRK